jgi:hypothetical protein
MTPAMPAGLLFELFPESFTMRLRPLACLAITFAALSAGAQTPPKKAGNAAPVSAGTAVLRVACDGAAANAEVTVNGVFKGDCPLDIPVPVGTIKLRVLKKVGSGRESVFEQEFRMTADTAKRVDVELGPPQLTAEGQRLENDRLAREKAEADRQAAERQRAAAAAMAQAAQATDVIASAMLAEERAREPGRHPDCVDCPLPPKNNGVPIRLEMPTAPDAAVNTWLQQARQEATLYQAANGTDFFPPAQAMAMPCDSAAAGMRAVARLVSMGDRPIEEQERFRKLMQPFSANPVSYLRDVKLWPVQAGCSAGQLSGPLEFWAFSVSVSGTDANITISRELLHVRTVMAAGKQAGPLTETKATRSLTRYTKPETEAMMKNSDIGRLMQIIFNTREASETATARSSLVLLSFFENPAAQKTQDLPHVSFVVPTSGDRGEQTSYSGTKVVSKTPLKLGRPHGQMSMYFSSPPTTLCYRDGELVKINPCNVN